MSNHHRRRHAQSIIDAMSTADGLQTGLSALVDKLASEADPLDDHGIVRQINDTRAALDRLETAVKAHIHRE